jgi:hypothetical protein
MALEIHLGRFYCTTSECEFGPVCASDKEAEILAYEVERTTGSDVRTHGSEALAALLADLRSGVMLTRETHSSRACYCGSGKPWVSKLQQMSKPSCTRCADCSGTDDPLAKVAIIAPAEGVMDLFDALKGALKKGQASTL